MLVFLPWIFMHFWPMAYEDENEESEIEVMKHLMKIKLPQ
jgi:hypothetical protein